MIFNDQLMGESVDYLLVNPKASIQMLLRKVNKKIIFREILDYNFIHHCIREGLLLAISKYSIYINRQFDQKEENEENTITMHCEPQKIVKT